MPIDAMMMMIRSKVMTQIPFSDGECASGDRAFLDGGRAPAYHEEQEAKKKKHKQSTEGMIVGIEVISTAKLT